MDGKSTEKNGFTLLKFELTDEVKKSRLDQALQTVLDSCEDDDYDQNIQDILAQIAESLDTLEPNSCLDNAISRILEALHWLRMWEENDNPPK